MVIAEDDDTYQPESPPEQLQEGLCPRWRSKQQPEKVLFCGWRRGELGISCVSRLVLCCVAQAWPAVQRWSRAWVICCVKSWSGKKIAGCKAWICNMLLCTHYASPVTVPVS